MLRQIQASLLGTRGKSPVYREIGDWTGVAEGSIKDWFNNIGNPTAEFLLTLLERIPESSRNMLLNKYLRTWPTIDHPRLCGDMTIVSALRSILCQAEGFTFIQGGSDEQRTFLLTALGHSAIGLLSGFGRIAGIDTHEPDWFVPVSGVTYLHNLHNPARIGEAVQRAWPKICSDHKCRLILVNGIWAALPELHADIYALTSRTNVIVADASTLAPEQIRANVTGPINLLSVTSDPAQPVRLRIDIQAA